MQLDQARWLVTFMLNANSFMVIFVGFHVYDHSFDISDRLVLFDLLSENFQIVNLLFLANEMSCDQFL